MRAGEVASSSAWKCGACDSCCRGPAEKKDYAADAQKLLTAFRELGNRLSAAKVSADFAPPEDVKRAPWNSMGLFQSN